MYLPNVFQESDLSVLHKLIRDFPLGLWVRQDAGSGLNGEHIPFLIDESRGEFGTLIGHVARSNPVWRHLSATPSLVAFQGPQTYITPSWYPSKHAHGKAVPTRSYAVVHVQGVATAIDDEAWLRLQVEAMTKQEEAEQAVPWQVSDAPEDYTKKMLGSIVGIEIQIASIHGKWKVNQNRTPSDRLGVLAGLQSKDGSNEQAMARLVARHTIP